MAYGYPVTGPMFVPQVGSSPYVPEEPGQKELPGIVDTSTTGIRLQGTQAKAMPRTTQVGQSDNRAREAEQLAEGMRRAYSLTRAYKAQNEAQSRAEEKATDDYARKLGRR